MSRPVALLTGGNSGIGLECARTLAGAGWHVVMASRDREASAEAIRRLEREVGAPCASELGLDLGSFASVRALAKEVESRDLPVRALICNAGIQVAGEQRLSPDGFELTFAVNHLGHFLLTNLLLRRLVDHAPARILVVASGVHDPKLKTGMPKASAGDIETLATAGGGASGSFDGRLAYVNSKLCNVRFTYELARRIEAAGLSSAAKPLSVNAFEPGLVPGSGLAREYPIVLRVLWDHVLPVAASVVTRFVPTINTAGKAGGAMAGIVLDPAWERVSGKYFPSHTRWQEGASSEASYDGGKARDLWEASVRLCGLTSEESPLVAPRSEP